MTRSKSFSKLRRIVTTFPGGVQTVSEAFVTDWNEAFTQTVNNANGNKITPNAYSFDRGLNHWVTGTQQRSNPAGNPRLVETYGPVGTTVPLPNQNAFPSNLYNEGLSKLGDKIRSSVDLSVDLMQAGQVSSMMSSARKTAQYVLSFRRGRWAEAYRDFRRDGRLPQRAGSKWLEYQYGWKPLAQTLYDSAIELSRVIPTLMKVEVTASDQKRYSDTVGAQHDPNVMMRRVVTEQQRIKFKAQFRAPTSTVQLLSNFTSLNPVSIAWELTPYSFVVDWFIDVGGYLRNLETACTHGSTFVNGFYTEGYRLDVSCQSFGSYTDGSNYIHTQDLKGSTVITKGRRTTLGSYPLPRVPQFKMDLGASRLLNAAALLSQHLGR